MTTCSRSVTRGAASPLGPTFLLLRHDEARWNGPRARHLQRDRAGARRHPDVRDRRGSGNDRPVCGSRSRGCAFYLPALHADDERRIAGRPCAILVVVRVSLTVALAVLLAPELLTRAGSSCFDTAGAGWFDLRNVRRVILGANDEDGAMREARPRLRRRTPRGGDGSLAARESRSPRDRPPGRTPVAQLCGRTSLRTWMHRRPKVLFATPPAKQTCAGQSAPRARHTPSPSGSVAAVPSPGTPAPTKSPICTTTVTTCTSAFFSRPASSKARSRAKSAIGEVSRSRPRSCSLSSTSSSSFREAPSVPQVYFGPVARTTLVSPCTRGHCIHRASGPL